jgi:hypothetical protein
MITHQQFVRKINDLRIKTQQNKALCDLITKKYAIKNVTGLTILPFVEYNDPFDIIAHLMVGSEGTLAFLSSITMTTGEIQPYSASALLLFPTTKAACEAITEMKQTGLLSAAEFFDRKAMQTVEKDFPELQILTLCQQDEEGYYHLRFCNENAQGKKDAISRLLISVDILLSSQAFAGSITTGPSVFVMKARHRDLSVQAVDCPREELATALRLPISKRSTISTEHLSRHATR